MFDSRRDWADAGFSVLERAHEARIMVARHPDVPGVLFKKYSNAVSVDQRKNYASRVEGSQRLTAFIREHGLEHVVVPDKRAIDLPVVFDTHGEEAQVLVVDQFDLVTPDETRALYGSIDPVVLRELCFVLGTFRGLDSIVDNVTFTTGGKVAFIDTEHWYGGRRRPYLRYIRNHLSVESRKLAKKMFRRLRAGEESLGALNGEVQGEGDDVRDQSSSWPRPLG